MSAVGSSESAPSIIRTDPSALAPRADGAATDRRRSDGPARRSRRALRAAVGLLLVVALLGGAGWAAVKYDVFRSTAVGPTVLTHQVARGNMTVSVTEDGTVESASNIEIRCLVAGGGTIKYIIPDGTYVTEKQKIVEIDSAVIDDQILQQKILVEKARAVRDQAKNDLEAAKIALREYVEGTFVKDKQAVDSQITIAEEGLRSSQNMLLYTERMFRKGYVTNLQLESQQFAVKRSNLDLDTAKTAKRVLEEFTFAKMKNDLETLVATAGAKSTSEQAAFELEESKLKRLELQKLNCVITAPQSGMVVYANESSGGRSSNNNAPKIEEGAPVRESQVIVRVPDLTQMQVKATIHESRVERVETGMPASIEIQKNPYTGHVSSVANQPEAKSWGQTINKYAATVRIDGVQSNLKPGYTAKVTILVADLKDVLTVPVQCVVQQANKFYCWKQVGDESVKTEVVLGLSDDRRVEVKSGLTDGDLVLQNPPEKSGGEFTRPADAKQFGSGSPGNGPSATGDKSGAGGAAGARTPGGGARSMPEFGTLDKNADGKVTVDELPEPMQPRFGALDTDGNGSISAAEFANRPRRPPGAGGPGGGPAAGAPSGGGNQ